MLQYFYQKSRNLTVALLSIALVCSLLSCIDFQVCSDSIDEVSTIQILISEAQPATMCDSVSTEKSTCSQDTFTFFRVDLVPNPELLGVFGDNIHLELKTGYKHHFAFGTDPPPTHFACPNKHRGPPVLV